MTGPDLAAHLVASRLAGPVATPVGVCIENARKLLANDPDYTFGLTVGRGAAFDEVMDALRACGVSLSEDAAALPIVDPAVAVAALERHRRGFAGLAACQGRVLLATGHAFALLPHYQRIAAMLRAAGCTVLQPLDSRRGLFTAPDGRRTASVRFLGGVGSLIVHGDIVHTHRATYMEALLAEVGGPSGVDVVFGDHGFAGAAVEAGVETYSIADVNDPALPLAQWRGRTDGVLVIDDGLNPSVYEPVTSAIIDDGWAR